MENLRFLKNKSKQDLIFNKTYYNINIATLNLVLWL